MARPKLFASVVAALLSAYTARAQYTWTGTVSTDWNTAGNWNPNGVPIGVNTFFAGAGIGTVNLSSSLSETQVAFSNPTGNYTLTATNGQNLGFSNDSGPIGISVAAGVMGTETINIPSVSLIGTLTLVNNSAASTTTLLIGSSTVIESINNDPGQGVIASGPGVTQISGAINTTSGLSSGLACAGPGTLTFSGDGSKLTGGLAVSGGRLILDYTTNTATKLSSGTLTLGGGILLLQPNSTTAVTQTISGGTTVVAGHTDVQTNGGTITLAAGTIHRLPGTTVDFFGTSGFNVTTTTGTSEGLLGVGQAFATFDNGSTWATVSGGAIAGLTTYGTNTFAANTNVDVTTSSSQANFNVNSLRVSAGSVTLTLSGTNMLQSGGILAEGAGFSTADVITGGTLTAPAGSELIVHQYDLVGFTINSALSSSTGLTKTGPWTLSIGGNNTGLTGPINVNRGSLTVTNPAAVNSASAIRLNDNRTSTSALQTFTVDLGNNISATIAPAVSVSAFNPNGGATVFSTGGSRNSFVTLSQITSTTGLTTPIQFTGDASDTSGFRLGDISKLTGSITLAHGSLGVTTSTDSALDPTNSLLLSVADATAGGLVFLNGGGWDGPVTIGATTRVVLNGRDGGFFYGALSSRPGSSSQFVKAGTGNLTIFGDGSGLLGGITLSGGILFFNYQNTALSSKLGGGALTLNGGEFWLSSAVQSFTQTIPGGTALAAGHTDVIGLNPGPLMTLAFGAITRSPGATMDISVPPHDGTYGQSFIATTTTTTTNGLLGTGPAFSTFGGGATWATASGGMVTGLSTYGTDTYSAGTNTDVSSGTAPAGFTTNSLRLNTGNLTLSFSGTNTLQSGGILVTPNAVGGTIAGGTLTAPSAGELIVHQYSAGSFEIDSALASTAGLTKTGPGVLILGGNNAGLSGPSNIDRGGLTVTNVAAVNAASQLNFNDDRDGPALQTFSVVLANNSSGTIAPPIRLTASSTTDYGTYFSTGSVTGSIVTLAGAISSAVSFTTPIRFTGDSSNTSGFNLIGTSSFTGNISLLHGSLGINGDAALGNSANTLILEVGDSTNGGLVFLNSGITVVRPIAINSVTRLVSNGADSNTIAGPITTAVGLLKDGPGTIVLSNPNNTVAGGVTISLGTLVVGALGALPGGVNITAEAGGTFTPFTSASATFGTLTLNGGTFRVPVGTGQQYSFNQIVTGPTGGTVDFTGTGADQLLLNAGASIAINGNSTWLSPANGTTILNATGATFPISVPAGVTLSNGIALASNSAAGYRITGGGTLFQNSDATNELATTAPITVTQGAFRLIDASGNGGIGNFGTGAFTLDGGAVDYAGATATTSKAIALTANGGAVEVESATTTVTANGAITGPAGLTKTGPGTLVLGSPANSFTSLTVAAGTIQTANDNTLGPSGSLITVGAAGILQYSGTASTSRTFNLLFGTLSVAGGGTLTLNGAAVNGGFVRGPGTFALTGGTSVGGATIQPSAFINLSGPAAFVNVTNGGSITVASGLTTAMTGFDNQGSGAITLGAVAQSVVSDFQTYGMLTLVPATVGGGQRTLLTNSGTTPLYFNGGSRTFIGTPQTAIDPTTGQPAFVAGIDLHGQNAVVAGGLLVNNGFIADSTNSGAHVVADFGSLVKGAGFFENPVVTENGGKFQAGNSPGSASFGAFVLGPGGVNDYVFAIDDATGLAGPIPDALGHVSGWGLVRAILPPLNQGALNGNGDFTWTATPGEKLTVALDTMVNPTMVGTDTAGIMADFDPSQPYTWTAVTWAGSYAGPTSAAALDAATTFDTGGFENPIAGSFGWNLDTADHALSLTYTPTAVPEPGTLALSGIAAIGWATFWRKRWQRIAPAATLSA